MEWDRWRSVSGALFVASVLLPAARDLVDLLLYFDDLVVPSVRARVGADVQHFAFHTLTPNIGLAVVASVTLAGIWLVNYRRGERWAWWALAFSGLTYSGVKVVASMSFYAHWHGIDWVSILIWLAAVGASIEGVRRHRRSARVPEIVKAVIKQNLEP
ncbi:MAG: hypothetical protein GEU73_08755 [Chloroflexi bacterium]|nr:hypothetical protein [Chloroflexota bacterium]